MTTATKISPATITRKLNAAGHIKAQWIRYGTHTTEGYMTAEGNNGAVEIDYYNDGSDRNIDDAFIARATNAIIAIATTLEQLGYQIEHRSNPWTGIAGLIAKGA